MGASEQACFRRVLRDTIRASIYFYREALRG